jgi:hypothetical protein
MLVCDECAPHYDIDRIWLMVSAKQRGDCQGCGDYKLVNYIPQMVGKKPNYREKPYGVTVDKKD